MSPIAIAVRRDLAILISGDGDRAVTVSGPRGSLSIQHSQVPAYPGQEVNSEVPTPVEGPL